MRTMTSEKLINRTSYTVSKKWDWYTVRDFCIRHEFYTRGDSEAYNTMLTYVDEHDPETLDIERVAFDILDHSSQEINDTFIIDDIMYLLNKECVCTYFCKVKNTEAEEARI